MLTFALLLAFFLGGDITLNIYIIVLMKRHFDN